MIDISDGLKNHYLFEYPINQLIEIFIVIFEEEKRELLRVYQERLESIYAYGTLNFSPTTYNISDMIVYKYFNDDLSFIEKEYVKCEKFKKYPFRSKILELEK